LISDSDSSSDAERAIEIKTILLIIMAFVYGYLVGKTFSIWLNKIIRDDILLLSVTFVRILF
jgi:hypothetical protein